MKDDRWKHLYSYRHDTSEHDTVSDTERCVACKQFQKHSFNLERDTPQNKRQDAITVHCRNHREKLSKDIQIC